MKYKESHYQVKYFLYSGKEVNNSSLNSLIQCIGFNLSLLYTIAKYIAIVADFSVKNTLFFHICLLINELKLSIIFVV